MKTKIMAGAIIALCFAAGIGVCAAERHTNARGNVNGLVQYFSGDILYLESEIGNLMAECGKELNG